MDKMMTNSETQKIDLPLFELSTPCHSNPKSYHRFYIYFHLTPLSANLLKISLLDKKHFKN